MTESRNPEAGEKPQDLPLRPRETFEEDGERARGATRLEDWMDAG